MRLINFLNENKFPLSALAKVAKQSSSFEEFSKYYTLYINHGYFWHLTDDKNFKLSKVKGPRDMSSLASGEMTPGAFMVTSDIDYWNSYYNEEEVTRPYAVLLDLSDIHPSKLRQVGRGFGNEIFIDKSLINKVSVVDVMPIKKALSMEKKFERMIPQSRKELEKFYNETI